MQFWCPDAPRPVRSAAAGGFSLIEAIVALAIVGLALAATAGVFSTGVQGHATAADVDAALAITESKIAEADATALLRAGSTQGVFAGRYQWRVSISPYRDGTTATTDGVTPALRLFRLEATTSWHDGRHQRQVSLATLRLAPAPP